MRIFHTAASCIALCVAAAGPAWAQETGAPQGDADGASTTDEIVVTGSRIARRDFQASSPIVTMDSSTVGSTGRVTLEDSLNQLPQFSAGSGAYSSGINSTGQATLNLRGLGASRNLILLDGRRLQPANSQQVVDINILPKNLIGDIEVISGGASAVYGSDAISGVVNFKLRQLTGLEITAQSNISEEGDGGVRDISGAYGTKFAQGKGHVLLAASYSDRDALDVNSRAFFRSSQGVSSSIPEAFFNGGANAPNRNTVNALFGQYGVPAGAVTPTAGFGVNNDGTLFATGLGVYNYRNNTPFVYNSGTALLEMPRDTYPQLPLKRWSTFGKVDFEVSPSVKLFVQGLYTNTKSVTSGDAAPNAGWQLSLPVTNPFIPAALRTLLASRPNPNAPVSLLKRYSEAGARITTHDATTYQITAGASGRFGASDITWDISGSHGDSRNTDDLSGAVFASRVQKLVSAADGGASLCAGGYNPFQTNGVSAECAAYISGTAGTRTRTAQDMVELNLQGPIANLPAGELRFAAGADYRRNSFAFEPDAQYQSGDVVGIPRTAPTNGSTRAVEGYAEVSAPLIHDTFAIRSMVLGLAYRYSDYDRSGGVSTYKADLDWTVVPGFRLRGGYQRAIRAPNVGELFSGAIGSFPTIGLITNGGGDPCDTRSRYRTGMNGAAVRAICVAQGLSPALVDAYVNNVPQVAAFSTGNPDLKPEKADTFTLGGVLAPRMASPWLSHLSLSVDYYKIKIADAIAVIPTTVALNKCFNADGSNPSFATNNFYCGLIGRDAVSGGITNALQPYLNLGGYRTSGVDMQLDWSLNLSEIGAGGGDTRLRLSTLVSYLDSFQIQQLPGAPWQEQAGSIGGGSAFPRWKANTTLTLGDDRFSGLLRWRYTGGMYDISRVTDATSTVPGVRAYSYFDASVQARIGKDYSLRLGINNLTDKQPPIVSGVAGSTDAQTYDILGRTFYAAVTAHF